MKKLLSILTALALTASSAVSALAISDTVYSTDAAELTATLSELNDSDTEDFINENLDVKMQHLSTLVTLSSNRLYDEIAGEVEAALKDGLTAVEIKEAIYHSAAYCGYTRAAGALDAADAALEALGQPVPYESRITSTEETRYDDGLAVQRTLFGPTIGTISDGMTEASRLQTIYLSGICFGDFYNRTGLSLYTREFLTFCTIVGNGNCGGQLGGHANGNLSIGHSADMLRAAVLLNSEYNGVEKTALALSVINNADRGQEITAPEEPVGKTETITTDYSSDSEELLSIIEHYESDDDHDYIDDNLDKETQELIIEAVNAVIDGTAVPTSDDAAKQALIDLTVIGAQGGREAEVADNLAANTAAGNTSDTMLAAALLCTPYNGYPRTLNITGAINSAVAAASETPIPTAETPTPAQVADEVTITMQIGNPVMTVNGEQQNIDENGTAPVIVNDRTLLPIRTVIEAIGGDVAWSDSSKTAGLTYGDRVITLTADSTTAYVLGEEYTLDVAPAIINDRTMLPIRFIAENFGLSVDWEQETQTVTIIKSGAPDGEITTISNVFGMGDLNPVAPRFTGVSYLKNIVSHEDVFNVPSFGLVTFEPCTRTDWHSHAGGQILLVTEGTGVFGMEGQSPRLMLPGDVIFIEPNVRHFHSAADNSWFSHIALGVNPGVPGGTQWYEKVSSEEHAAAVAEARANGHAEDTDNTMFPTGEAVTESGYIGNVFVNTLVPNEEIFNSPEIRNYTFEMGARTDWHSHEGGQVIVVTDGIGIYQEQGQSARILKPGDVVLANPGVTHWHGAADEEFAYISVNANPGSDTITWGEAVTDEEYNSATSAAK
ncbi:MAG: carboxymuconolactone decarboxylase family protein [Oscillospiraceae bacterium]|nr:carboxymuconolactone decarboxylase family protein [Oscillospiraceae bacterium]